MINLRHLRAFEAAARLGSLNKACQEIHLSQSAMIYAIGKLESEIGTRLLDRHNTGSALTPPGECLFARTKSLIRKLDDAVCSLLHELKGNIGDAARISRSLTIPQLEALASIAQLHQPEIAARNLAISKATLLRQLNEIERQIGAELMTHLPLGTYLSEQGARFERRIGLALREIDFARQEIAALSKSGGAKIRVGCLGMSRAVLLPGALRRYWSQFPEVQVKLLQFAFETLYDMLSVGRIDFLICGERKLFDSDDVEVQPLFQDKTILVCRKEHPILQRNEVRLKDIEQYPIIAPPAETPIRIALDEACACANVVPNIVLETHSVTSIASLVRQSDFLMLSDRAVEHYAKTNDLHLLNIPIPSSDRHVCLFRRRDTVLPDTHLAFAKALELEARSLFE